MEYLDYADQKYQDAIEFKLQHSHRCEHAERQFTSTSDQIVHNYKYEEYFDLEGT